MWGQERAERRLKWRKGRVGETGREKEVGESQGPFWEEGEGLRPREGGLRTQEEGEQEGDPACLSQSPLPHPGSGGGCLVGQILSRLWPGDRGGGQGQERQVTDSSYLFPFKRQLTF